MRTLLIAVMMLLTTVSCLPDKKGKDKDPEPELAGTYQVSRFVDESQNVDIKLPNSSLSVVIIVTRPSDTQLSFRIDVTENGKLKPGTSATTTIRKASGKEYDILDGSDRVGSIDGTDFSLDYEDGGYRYAIKARK